MTYLLPPNHRKHFRPCDYESSGTHKGTKTTHASTTPSLTTTARQNAKHKYLATVSSLPQAVPGQLEAYASKLDRERKANERKASEAKAPVRKDKSGNVLPTYNEPVKTAARVDTSDGYKNFVRHLLTECRTRQDNARLQQILGKYGRNTKAIINAFYASSRP